MYKINPISIHEFQLFIKSDPNICFLGVHDAGLAALYAGGDYEIPPHSKLLGCFNENGDLVATSRYEMQSEIAINFHMYLATKYHHTGAARATQEAYRQYFMALNPAIRRAFLQVPAPCVQVINAALSFGCVQEGCLKNALTWREKATDLLIFGLDLYPDQVTEKVK